MVDVYLRAEAVNLANVITDTEDLSTIRGSGLMILDLSPHVEIAIKNWRAGIEAERVTSGASQTVFRVTLGDTEDPDDLAARVASTLRTDPLLRYATIVVNHHTGDYDQAREALLSKNRWQQLKQSRVSIAGSFSTELDQPAEDASRRAPWCFVDQIRPAARLARNARNEEKQLVSESVKARREYGFSEKQNFYKREVAWEPTADIVRRMVAAWHFHQIAEFDRDDQGKPTREYAHLAPNLNGKIAVFYVDGNGFGSIQAGKCSSVTRQQQWDKLVQGQKTAALKAVLDQAWEKKSGDQVGPGWWNKASNMEWRHRFETLLWGGDELLWVVPAWQGWNVARTFFETVRSLQPAEEPPQQGLEVAPAPPSAPLRPAAATGKQGVRNLDAKASKKEREQAEREKQAAVARLLAAEAEARREQASGPAEFGRLSYSAGLVFCHAEAPIQRVWALSKDLAEVAKRVGKTKSAEADKDLVAYAVLESFDQLGQDVHAARTRHLPFPPSNEADETAKRLRQTVLHADDLADGHLLDHIRWMKDHFPHGAVYKLLRVLRTEQEAGPRRSEFRHWLTRATTEIPDAKTNEHLAAFGGRCVGSDRVVLSSAQRINWLHLAELWDYIV